MIPDASPDALNLLNQLLQLNPDKRLSADQALRHPYVRRLFDSFINKNYCISKIVQFFKAALISRRHRILVLHTERLSTEKSGRFKAVNWSNFVFISCTVTQFLVFI